MKAIEPPHINNESLNEFKPKKNVVLLDISFLTLTKF